MSMDLCQWSGKLRYDACVHCVWFVSVVGKEWNDFEMTSQGAGCLLVEE